MYTFVIGLLILFSVLLVLVVLAQNSKGGGLTSQFGGSAASNIIGVKKTGDLLEKLTWSFIIGIFVLTLATKFVQPGRANADDVLDLATPAAAPAATPSLNLDSTGTSGSDSTK